MWQELEGSKMLSRIIRSQWRCRLGQLCLWSTVGRESRAVTCRKRVLARGGQGLVMVETQKLRRKEGNQES